MRRGAVTAGRLGRASRAEYAVDRAVCHGARPCGDPHVPAGARNGPCSAGGAPCRTALPPGRRPRQADLDPAVRSHAGVVGRGGRLPVRAARRRRRLRHRAGIAPRNRPADADHRGDIPRGDRPRLGRRRGRLGHRRTRRLAHRPAVRRRRIGGHADRARLLAPSGGAGAAAGLRGVCRRDGDRAGCAGTGLSDGLTDPPARSAGVKTPQIAITEQPAWPSSRLDSQALRSVPHSARPAAAVNIRALQPITST
uniref:Uncharacterized protein n=1 Tax=Ralstonia solanacearum TaxID=305 RepID=A0A0S4TX29_RALSL|nr:protein of unknown function [Ralstonia solanacearum]